MARKRVIDSFSGQYSYLSNFYPTPVDYEGVTYPSSEHAFQAAKTEDSRTRRIIASAASPGMAKAIGRTVRLRKGWDDMRIEVMRGILHDKFDRREALRFALLDTGDAKLVEGNTWGDTFWGVCNGEGENHLGKLLMQLREELRHE